MDRRGALHGWGLLATAGVGTVAVALMGMFQSVTAGFTVVDLLGGILTTLVLLLLAQVIALRNQASANAAKVGRAIADIAAAQADLKALTERLIVTQGRAERNDTEFAKAQESVEALTARVIDVVGVAKHNDEELARLRDGRHDYETRVNNIIDVARVEIARLGGYKGGGKR